MCSCLDGRKGHFCLDNNLGCQSVLLAYNYEPASLRLKAGPAENKTSRRTFTSLHLYFKLFHASQGSALAPWRHCSVPPPLLPHSLGGPTKEVWISIAASTAPPALRAELLGRTREWRVERVGPHALGVSVRLHKETSFWVSVF